MPTRNSVARALLKECERVYSSLTKEEDLRSDQTVAHYSTEEGQKKYVHMYFAKQVALWRCVRRRVGDAGPIWSIGAGPMLDLFGWFWERRAQTVDKVIACDILDWSHVRNLEAWKILADGLLAGHQYNALVTVPEPSHLPQCLDLPATALTSADVDDGATVLFPFVLNHILGRNAPAGNDARDALKVWGDDILRRRGRMIIADLHASMAPEFWHRIQTVWPSTETAVDYNFAGSIGGIASLYDGASVSRRGSSYMSVATVMVVEADRTWFL